MAAHVKAADDLSEDARALTSVVQEGELSPGKVIAFSRLDKGFTQVSENKGELVRLGGADSGVRAPGLHSCAAVCFLNTNHADGDVVGYVLHANTGTIPYATFMEIIKAIGGRQKNAGVYVAYAHRGNTDKGHDNTVKDLREWLDKGKLVQITNLFLNEFAMNGLFQIGY